MVASSGTGTTTNFFRLPTLGRDTNPTCFSAAAFDAEAVEPLGPAAGWKWWLGACAGSIRVTVRCGGDGVLAVISWILFSGWNILILGFVVVDAIEALRNT